MCAHQHPIQPPALTPNVFLRLRHSQGEVSASAGWHFSHVPGPAELLPAWETLKDITHRVTQGPVT